MRLVKVMGAAELQARSDSQLVTDQVSGEYQAKDPQLAKYLNIVRALIPSFSDFKLTYVPREQNARADLLSKLASTKKPGNNKSVIQEALQRPSIENEEVLFLQEEYDSWIGPIIYYLEHGTIPSDREQCRKLTKEAARYTIIAGRLYKRGFSTPLLLCLAEGQTDYVLREVHEGICETHIGG